MTRLTMITRIVWDILRDEVVSSDTKRVWAIGPNPEPSGTHFTISIGDRRYRVTITNEGPILP